MNSKGIASFWKAFLALEKSIGRPENPDDKDMMKVLEALKKIDPRLYYHVGHTECGPDLLLSAEGNYDLGPTLDAIVAAVPECPGWHIRPVLEADELFGQRNLQIYPEDENGDVLFSAAQQGDNLLRARDVEFCHVFRTEKEADAFVSDVANENVKCEVSQYSGRRGYKFEVIVARGMTPIHRDITSCEKKYADIAAKHGGIPDGWGFMDQKD